MPNKPIQIAKKPNYSRPPPTPAAWAGKLPRPGGRPQNTPSPGVRPDRGRTSRKKSRHFPGKGARGTTKSLAAFPSLRQGRFLTAAREASDGGKGSAPMRTKQKRTGAGLLEKACPGKDYGLRHKMAQIRDGISLHRCSQAHSCGWQGCGRTPLSSRR